MRIVLDDTPVGLNSGNGLLRMGRFKRSKYNQYWRDLVRAAIRNDHKTPRGRQIVYISQMRPRLFKDEDNLYGSCKPILDALVHWKLIKDDSTKYIELRPLQQKGKQKITIIVIQPAPQDTDENTGSDQQYRGWSPSIA